MITPEHLRPYAGRWVALVQGRVAGVGWTADEARVAAQMSRPKETPLVMFVPEYPPLDLPDLVSEVRHALPDDLPVWLVGGAIRDSLLKRKTHDLDFAVAGDALAAARQVAEALGAAVFPLDAGRDVGRVILLRDETRYSLDFARLRGDELAADLAGRDFTINAMAAALADPQTLLDPLGGEKDLRDKCLRACSPTAIADDPVRGVRAIRLGAQLGFRLDKGTRRAIREQAQALSQVSAERKRDEFIRCLGGPRPAAALRALDLLGLLGALVPEAARLKGLTQPPPHTVDVWEHTLAVVTHLYEVLTVLAPVYDAETAADLTLGLVSVQLGRHRQALDQHLRAPLSGDRPARWLLMLAAFLHDIGKPDTRSVETDGRIRFINHEVTGADLAGRCLDRLHFSSEEIKRAQTIVAHHMRPRQLSLLPKAVTRRAVYRFFRDTGEAGVDIVLLSLADFLAKYYAAPPPQDEWARHLAVCAQLMTAYYDQYDQAVWPSTFLTGHDLMNEFGLEAGPQLGELLEALREAQAAGELADREAALDFVRRKLAET